MTNKKFYINESACFFDEETDKNNDYWTIVFNPIQEKFIKINQLGYKILKTIEENPSINFQNLLSKVKMKEIDVKRFLENMIKENIVFAL